MTNREDILALVDTALSRLESHQETTEGILRTVTVLEQLTRALQTLDCVANEIGAIQ